MLTEKGIEHEIYNSKDKDLLKFIRNNFEKNDRLNKSDIEVLEKLENNTINLGLARMKKIKEEKNLVWIRLATPFIILIIATIVAYLSYSIIFDINQITKKEKTIEYILNIIILFSIFFLIHYKIQKTKGVKMTTDYFSVLLNEIKEDNKNKKEDSKNKINDISKINKKSEIVIIYTSYH